MKITIELDEGEGTTKERVENELKKFLAFHFWNGSNAKIEIE